MFAHEGDGAFVGEPQGNGVAERFIDAQGAVPLGPVLRGHGRHVTRATTSGSSAPEPPHTTRGKHPGAAQVAE